MRYSRADNVLFRTVEGEAVLVDLARGSYFGLDEVGTAAWDALGPDGRALDDVIAVITAAFEVDPATARADLAALFEDMLAQGLVERSDG